MIPDAAAWGEVGEILGEDILALLRAIPPRYNISPTQLIPIIITGEDGKPALVEARWGFVPHYWNRPELPTKTTNVRSETAASKPMWKHSWRRTRCLIPASGWYEWFNAEDGTARPPKVPHHIRREDGKHILFAAVWADWPGAHGFPAMRSCAIATIPSPPSIARIHARTPIVLEPAFWRRWIDPQVTEAADVADMVRAGAVALFGMDPLGPDVSNSRNDGPDLIAPRDRAEMAGQEQLLVDNGKLAWLNHTPAAELRKAIGDLLDQNPLPALAERRLWYRQIEDRDDADELADLMAEIKASFKTARPTRPQKPPPPQADLF